MIFLNLETIFLFKESGHKKRIKNRYILLSLAGVTRKMLISVTPVFTLSLINQKNRKIGSASHSAGIKPLQTIDCCSSIFKLVIQITLTCKKIPRINFQYSVSFITAEYEFENKFFPSRQEFWKFCDKCLKGCVYDEVNQKM